MSRKQASIDFRVFTRIVSKRKRFYIRFLYKGKVFLTRATDAPTVAKAGAIAAQIIEREDLEALAKAKELGKTQALDEIDRHAKMPVAAFLQFFWDPDTSPYLADLAAANKALSGSYIRDMRSNVKRFFVPVGLFAEMPIRELKLKHVDSLFRELRIAGKSRTMLNSIRHTIQTPCNWLAIRNGMPKINFAAMVMPNDTSQERGILTMDEVENILDLEASGPWQDAREKWHIALQARDRLPDGVKNKSEPPAGWREKLIIVLGALTGMRVGEMRALQWKNVDLQNGLIHIVLNYTDLDGLKEPKARSRRDVPISMALEGILLGLRKISQLVGAAKPDNFVLLNSNDFSKPIAESTIKRAWVRILRTIGISEEQQKEILSCMACGIYMPRALSMQA